MLYSNQFIHSLDFSLDVHQITFHNLYTHNSRKAEAKKKKQFNLITHTHNIHDNTQKSDIK